MAFLSFLFVVVRIGSGHWQGTGGLVWVHCEGQGNGIAGSIWPLGLRLSFGMIQRRA